MNYEDEFNVRLPKAMPVTTQDEDWKRTSAKARAGAIEKDPETYFRSLCRSIAWCKSGNDITVTFNPFDRAFLEDLERVCGSSANASVACHMPLIDALLNGYLY